MRCVQRREKFDLRVTDCGQNSRFLQMEGSRAAISPASRSNNSVVEMRNDFRVIVFFSVLGLTVLAGSCAVLLSVMIREPSDQLNDAISSMMWLSTLGAGAIIGSISRVVSSGED